MIRLRSLSLCVLAGAVLCSAAALAQQPAPAVRILSPIDESQLVTLARTVHPLANAANDRGAAPGGMELDRLQLTLQRSPAQEAALRQLIAQMHTPGSPSYHQWLTPEQFGAQFGPADQDIATVSTWLSSHGFSVAKVNPGKGTLEFSGTVAQMREAFHTQIHKFAVNGETHYANSTDPSIPAALAPVIGGFASLNNFRLKSHVEKLGEASFNPLTHQVTPSWTWGTTGAVNFVLAPADFAVQYDLNPLYKAGIVGTGQTIAIVNDSNININLVNQYRTLFGLPANPPQVIIDGNDPGVDGINNPDGPNGDSVEAYLDVEQSGAVAYNATVDLVIGADTALESGLFLAIERAVYSNVAPVISLSFGSCEAHLGSTNAFLNAVWEQAAAQGQTVLVSAGDNGSAGCDNDDTQEYAVNGQAVSGLASTPYDVAVGGTDFYYSQYNAGSSALDAQIATYWNTTPSQSPAVSLLQYVPEQPWNSSQYGLDAFNYYTQVTGSTATTIVGGSGGASNAAVCSTSYNLTTGACPGTLAGYPKPAWQTGTGVPADGVRDVPDISLFASNGPNYSFYPICATDGDCQPPSGSNIVQIFGVGGTSASTPAFAGIIALVNQYETQKLGSPQRQGQADTVLYPLKAQFPSAFHDVTNGTNSEPCEILPTATPNCIAVTGPITVDITLSDGDTAAITEGQIGNTTADTPEYNAAAGYNLATGLGTIDANNLVTNWGSVKFASSTTSLTANPTTITHGQAVSVSGTVTGSSPTGNVALLTDSTEPTQQGVGFGAVSVTLSPSTFALSGGAYSGSVTTLPGGTYNVWASYGGDANNAASVSQKQPITVTAENSGIDFTLLAASGATTSPGSSVDYGTQLVLSARVVPSSQLSAFESCTTSCPVFTIPTGAVTFTDSASGSGLPATQVLNAEGDAEINAPFAVGSHSITAAYSGDFSYNKSSSASPIAFAVVKDTPTILPQTSVTDSNGDLVNGPGQATVLTIEVANTAQSNAATSTAVFPVPVAPPTGSVTLSSSLAGFTGKVSLSPGVDPSTNAVAGFATFTVPANTVPASGGTYQVTASYSGDNNYNAIPVGSSTTYSIPIVSTNGDGGLNATIAATIAGSISPNTSVTVAGTVTGQGSKAPTGGIYVYSSGSYPFSTPVPFSSTTGDVASFSVTLNSQSLFQGANFITLQYLGDSNYNPASLVLNNNTAIQNPLSDFTLVPLTTIVPVNVSGGANNGTDTINVSSVNGFSGNVNLACSAPAGIACSISPAAALSSGSSTTATLTISAQADTANQNYNVLVTGTDAATGEFIHTLAIQADVSGSAAGTQSFALTNSGNLTLNAGSNGTATITVTSLGGFTGTVKLGCAVTASSGASSPAACSLSASSVPINPTTAANDTLTVTTTSSTTAGNYTVTVTGTGSNSSGTALTVTTQIVVGVGTPTFAISNSGAVTIASPGSSGTATITITPSDGLTGTVSLTCALATSPSGANDPATCTIPGSVSIANSSAQTATLSIATTAATAASLAYPRIGSDKGWLGAGSGALLALLLFFGIPARRRSWRSMLAILVVFLALGVLSSCGGGSSGGGSSGGGGNSGTTTGSYSFTVTGTYGSGATAITQTTTVGVTVN